MAFGGESSGLLTCRSVALTLHRTGRNPHMRTPDPLVALGYQGTCPPHGFLLIPQVGDHPLVRFLSFARTTQHSYATIIPIPPANQSDIFKYHGQSGGDKAGEVRYPMTSQPHFY